MQTKIAVQSDDFDVNAEIAALTDGRGDIGAVVTFSGHVRGDDGLTAMTLEHYPGMTEREIAAHVEEAQARWPLMGVSVIHRIGKLLPGARIVLVDSDGVRATVTGSWLRQMGFTDVYVLRDGLAGMPLETGPWRPRVLGLSGISVSEVSATALRAPHA